MTPASTLIRRITLARQTLRNVDSAPSATAELRRRAGEAADVLDTITEGAITAATRRLGEHQAGYPSQSGGASPSGSTAPGGVNDLGRPSYSDRVGDLAANNLDGHGDHVDRISDELAAATLDLERNAWAIITAGTLSACRAALETVERSTQTVQRIVQAWDDPPAVRWCTHCWDTNRHRELVWTGRYKDLCRRCGDWRAVNKELPPRDIIPYLQRGEARKVPQQLLDRHKAKRPRSVR